jgi:gamma-glutamylcyclotransferase (GGCT)/AIG2-like uncharacterized protein YtfP
MVNYRRFRRGMEFLFTETISGYRLHALRWYPYAVKSSVPGEAIVVEVFRLTNEGVEKAIHELEVNEGFVYDEVNIRGQKTGIYLFETAGPEPSVMGGDWVKFFGSR